MRSHTTSLDGLTTARNFLATRERLLCFLRGFDFFNRLGVLAL